MEAPKPIVDPEKVTVKVVRRAGLERERKSWVEVGLGRTGVILLL